VYRLGYLFEGTRIVPDPPQLKALEERLRELGYVEGRNLVVERRYAAFKYDRLPELASELVRLKPDVIMAGGNPSIAASEARHQHRTCRHGIFHRPGRCGAHYQSRATGREHHWHEPDHGPGVHRKAVRSTERGRPQALPRRYSPSDRPRRRGSGSDRGPSP
jgi:hypothetical protein